jgi:hypothetical protein
MLCAACSTTGEPPPIRTETVVKKPPAALLKTCETYRPTGLNVTGDLVAENGALWDAYNGCIAQTSSLQRWDATH